MDKLEIIKLKNFCALKRRHHQGIKKTIERGKYLQILYLIRDFCLEYIENFYNLKKLKIGKESK